MREEDGFKIDIGAWGGVGERYWRGLGRIDINGEWIGWVWDGVRGGRVISFRLGLGVLRSAIATDGTWAGGFLKYNHAFKVAVCKVDTLDGWDWGGWFRLGTDVGWGLTDCRGGERRLEGRLEGLSI